MTSARHPEPSRPPPHASEVAPGILRIEAPLGERINALYVLHAHETPVLLWDTGTVPDPPGALSAALEERGMDPAGLRFVVNSHADVDHMGGNRAIRAMAPSAALMCGEADRPLIEDLERMIELRYGEFGPEHGIALEPGMAEWCREVGADAPIDVGLVGGEHLRLERDRDAAWGVQVLATPGHSHGSISLWDPRGRALLIGDAALGAAVRTAGGQPAFPPTYRHVDDYLATIGRIEGLAPDLLLASHEPVMRGSDAGAFLAASRDFVSALDDRARAALRRASWTLADLALELGPRMGDWPAESHPVMRFPLLGHLERLVSRGEARVERLDDRLVYRWAGS